MSKIKVQQIQEKPSYKFNVVEVVEDQIKTRHTVSMGRKFYEDLNTDIEPWEVIGESFRFLLERESKKSILREFDVTLISRFFPEYVEKLKETLGNRKGK